MAPLTFVSPITRLPAASLPHGAFVTKRATRKACPTAARRVFPTSCATSAQTPSACEELPWGATIASDDMPLLFMPFLENQQQKMQDCLPELCRDDVPTAYAHKRSEKTGARTASMSFSSADFRKIRLTYVDAGSKVQMFNTMWFPQPKYDAPVLGVEFVAYGSSKVFVLMDFMPLQKTEDYIARYCDRLVGIQSKYDELGVRKGAEHFENIPHVSRHAIVAGFGPEGCGLIENVLSQLFTDYLDAYIGMVVGGDCLADDAHASVARVQELHTSFDQHMAEKDAGQGPLGGYFGKEWAKDFTYNFMFSGAALRSES